MRHWFTMKKNGNGDDDEDQTDDDDEDTGDEDDDKKKKNPFAEILIYDAIGQSFMGENTVGAKAFIDGLAALGEVDEIKLRINSPGGDVFDGVAIYNALKNHKAKVTAHVDGLAASAASFVAMAADRIVMPSNSFMLVHNASGFSMGTADDMRALAEDLDRIDASMVATYVARTGATQAVVKNLMKEDRLMDAKEAKELGFTDEVTKPVKLRAAYSLSLLPPAAADQFRNLFWEPLGTQMGTEQGDPPPSAPGPEESGAQALAPPTPPKRRVKVGAKVIDISAASKQAGIEEHRRYVADVTDLCTLAGAAECVGGFVRANTSLARVRKELLYMKASTPAVISQHPLVPSVTPTASWDKITDKLNARKNRGGK
jgi:ATP-dependent Clp protease, protease subunit